MMSVNEVNTSVCTCANDYCKTHQSLRVVRRYLDRYVFAEKRAREIVCREARRKEEARMSKIPRARRAHLSRP